MNIKTSPSILISAQQAQPDTSNAQPLPPLTCEISAGKMIFLLGAHYSISLPYMHLLAGLASPVSGRVMLLGQDSREMTPLQRQGMRQKIGFVLQGGPLLSVLNGFENIMLAARYHRLAPESDLQLKAQSLLEEFPHEADYRLLPAFMSKLQRRLLAIARPLMLDPQLLFIDSPFDGLDHHDRVVVARYIANITNHKDITLILCSDDLYYAHSLADQIIFCDADEALVFNDWQSFHQSRHETIALLFNQEHI